MTLSRPSSNTHHQYALLRIYAWYRAALAALLIGVLYFSTRSSVDILSIGDARLFQVVSKLYGAITVVTLLRLYRKSYLPSDQHLFLVCFTDIICLALIMHSCGGVDSGLGLLLLVTVSAASIMLGPQLTALIASLATLAILASAFSEILYNSRPVGNLLPAGLLGFLFFVSAQLFHYLTKRIRVSMDEAELQSQRRSEIQQLNELIIRRMRTGLIVLAPNGSIRLINDSAARLLNISLDNQSNDGFSFAQIPALYESLQQWRHAPPRTRLKPVHITAGGPELQLSFAGLDQGNESDILVFVEDAREMAQQAQQLKLASLGHLTANIAHEIRNPLGAISHAAQLLAESETLHKNDLRLSEIIQNHSNRVNQIVENVLQLSRRQQPQPQRTHLQDLLEHFVDRYRQSHHLDMQLEIDCDDAALYIHVDSSQIEQVLNNLCDNGLRYSHKQTGKASLLLKGYRDPSLGTPSLEIIDDGPGIKDSDLAKIFEPFFTTDPHGTGLGLYLAQEICMANHAQLDYKHTDEGKSCFLIRFSHPDKTIAKATAT